MLHIPAPYKRKYHHTKSKGKESTVVCAFCGKQVPRWKAIPVVRSFRLTDAALRKQFDRKQMSTFGRKSYACPSCARYRGIIKPGHSRKSRNVQR